MMVDDVEARQPSLPATPNADLHTSTIATFFIVKQHRGSGLGREVMDEMERLAHVDFGCKVITLNTLPERIACSDDYWTSQGMPPSNIDSESRIINQ